MNKFRRKLFSKRGKTFSIRHCSDLDFVFIQLITLLQRKSVDATPTHAVVTNGFLETLAA